MQLVGRRSSTGVHQAMYKRLTLCCLAVLKAPPEVKITVQVTIKRYQDEEVLSNSGKESLPNGERKLKQ